MSEKRLTVGKIVNTHGIRGEVKVLSQTDFADVRFESGSLLYLTHPDNGVEIPVKVSGSRPQKNMFIVKFKEFADINEVEKYKGWLLKVKEDQLLELPEDEFYLFEIIGCKAVTEDGEELGEITEVLSPGANDVWVITPPNGKQILVPYIDDCVLNVDVERKIVTVHLMEGLV